MKTKRFIVTTAIITMVVAMFMAACNPFLHEEMEEDIDNLSTSGKPGSASSKPGTPTGLTTTGATHNSITLSWTAVSGTTGYNVYRSSSASGTYTQVGTPTTNSYTNTGLTAGTTYYYKVAARNSSGASSQSTYIFAATQASATNSITISGTPKVGEKLTVATTGAGWSDSTIRWGYAASADGTFTIFTTGMSGTNNSEFTIPATYNGQSMTGMYIRAFRQHPSGTWYSTANPSEKYYPSNWFGPVQALSSGGGDWVTGDGTWPEEWFTYTFWYTTSRDHFLQLSNSYGWVYLDGAVSGTHYKITSMTSNKQGIRVKRLNRPTNFDVIGDEITLCTSWTFQNNQLTLRGTTSVFSVFEGIPLRN